MSGIKIVLIGREKRSRYELYEILYYLFLCSFDVEVLSLAESFNVEVREEPVVWTEIDGSKLGEEGGETM